MFFYQTKFDFVVCDHQKYHSYFVIMCNHRMIIFQNYKTELQILPNLVSSTILPAYYAGIYARYTLSYSS